MKTNKIIRLVILAVVITIAVSIGRTSLAQPENRKGYVDYKEFPVVNWNDPEPANPAEREERRKKNARYDKLGLLMSPVGIDWSKPGQLNAMITADCAPPFQPIFPIAENDAVVIGKILSGKASISKTGVYSEYIVEITEIIKNVSSNKMTPAKIITIDQPGGSVFYPNGDKAFYKLSWKNLPRVGSDYLLFLRDDNQSPNYEIRTGFELRDGRVNYLDRHYFPDLSDSDISKFIDGIRNKIQEDSQSNKIREKP